MEATESHLDNTSTEEICALVVSEEEPSTAKGISPVALSSPGSRSFSPFHTNTGDHGAEVVSWNIHLIMLGIAIFYDAVSEASKSLLVSGRHRPIGRPAGRPEEHPGVKGNRLLRIQQRQPKLKGRSEKV